MVVLHAKLELSCYFEYKYTTFVETTYPPEKIIDMYIKIFTVFVALLSQFSSCSSKEGVSPRIDWDEWGVPHITARTAEELFYAQGWAQMHNHANLILRLYGHSRGRAAEYWGEELLPNDILVHTLGFEELAAVWEEDQHPETKALFRSFVAGMNAYAEAHPDAISHENAAVLPITTQDVNMHSMFVVFTRFIAGGELRIVQRWSSLGSNAYAIAPSRSASRNALLLQNPHLPWSNEFTFFESHLMLPDKNLYGSTLVGLPGISIGFNENLGWTHTNNTIDNADTYELELKDGGYLLDGQRLDFETSHKTLRVKQVDGTLDEQEITATRTLHGPVVAQQGNKVLALRMVGLDRPDMLLQWWRMAGSDNLAEFESALKMAQIGFWNVIYADREGNIFYLFNGLVPLRGKGDWSFWNGVIPGGKSEHIWSEVHPYEELPMLMNPESGWVQNANVPPWTSTYPVALHPGDYPPYMAPVTASFRPQRALRMIAEDSLITFQELMDYHHSTRLEYADRVLDDLFDAIDAFGSEKAKEAKKMLEKWDRKADVDSRGTVLFYLWSTKFNVNDPSNYVTSWSLEEPYSTPRGIAHPKEAVRLLEEAAGEMESRFGSLDLPWGEFYRLRRNNVDLPASGGPERLGIFRVAGASATDDGRMAVHGGDSWVGVIEFGDTVKAKVLLSYGNSSQPGSPHNGDQLELFSKKELRDAWFTREEVEAHTVRTELLQK